MEYVALGKPEAANRRVLKVPLYSLRILLIHYLLPFKIMINMYVQLLVLNLTYTCTYARLFWVSCFWGSKNSTSSINSRILIIEDNRYPWCMPSFWAYWWGPKCPVCPRAQYAQSEGPSENEQYFKKYIYTCTYHSQAVFEITSSLQNLIHIIIN